jgi:hypothetical protein
MILCQNVWPVLRQPRRGLGDGKAGRARIQALVKSIELEPSALDDQVGDANPLLRATRCEEPVRDDCTVCASSS